MPRTNSYRTYLTRRFGKPVLKIPLNAGFSCPNRDGTKSSGGCTFCDNRSFSPVADTIEPVLVQLQKVMTRTALSNRPFEIFIAYLQPFSNTYCSVEQLQQICEPLVSIPGIVGIAIGTRPDCFSPEMYDYLEELSTRTYLSVELGLQSSHDSTLRQINRNHTFDDFKSAVVELASRRVETVAHVMLGLCDETAQQMDQTAQRLASLPVAGVKIHQLMIVKNTALCGQYAAGEVSVLLLEQYARLLGSFIGYLRPDQYVYRMMADSTVEHGLVAPLWSADKAGSLKYINAYFEENDIVQGRAVVQS